MKPTYYLWAVLTLLTFSVGAESLKRSDFIEGTVVDATLMRNSFKRATKIQFREDSVSEAVAARRFCGDWSKRIERYTGKRIHIDLFFRDYASGECLKITGIELASKKL